MAKFLPEASQKQFRTIVTELLVNKFNPQTGTIAGETLQTVESELGRLSRTYGKSAVASERELGQAIKQLQATIREALIRVNPEHAADLSKIRQSYAMLLRLENAAGHPGSKEGVFSAAALRNASKTFDPSRNKRATARGNALMQDIAEAGERVLGPTVPDSGTPFRLGNMAALMQLDALLALLGAGALYGPVSRPLLTGLIAGAPQTRGALAAGVRRVAPYGAAALAPPLYGLLDEGP